VRANRAILAFARDGAFTPAIFTTDNEQQSGWSPDGLWLAHTRRDAVYVGPWDGSAEAEPLTKPNDDPINNTQPAWSPDGERIVFRTDRSDPSRNVADIWVMDSPAVAPAQRASARQPWRPCKREPSPAR
jgi:Tol biopolymer transport system component